MSLKILKFTTYGPFQARFAFPFQAVDGCGRLFDTDLSHHQFAILVHDVISGFALESREFDGWPDDCLRYYVTGYRN